MIIIDDFFLHLLINEYLHTGTNDQLGRVQGTYYTTRARTIRTVTWLSMNRQVAIACGGKVQRCRCYILQSQPKLIFGGGSHVT
ncbi:hypothetical protein FKM82_013807 [Ascaphus truei]